MNRYAIIVAGGHGQRMLSTIPKQFLLLDGKPVLMHTLDQFHKTDGAINLIIVLPVHQFDYWDDLCRKYEFAIPTNIVMGGQTRFHSVKNALNTIDDSGIVAVHDGVRPLVSRDLIIQSFSVSEKNGNAVPVLPMNDSLRQKEGKKSIALDRNSYVRVQTPQCFDIAQLQMAYKQPFSERFTDDATVVEASGVSINLIAGDENNIKITLPRDLLFAEALLKE